MAKKDLGTGAAGRLLSSDPAIRYETGSTVELQRPKLIGRSSMGGAPVADVAELPDDLLLDYAGDLARRLVTHDIRLHVMATNWQRQSRRLYGPIFRHLM